MRVDRVLQLLKGAALALRVDEASEPSWRQHTSDRRGEVVAEPGRVRAVLPVIMLGNACF